MTAGPTSRSGHLTPHRTPATISTRTLVLCALAGVLLAVAWSYEFVDATIGDNVAGALLGHDPKETAITGLVAGAAFALVSGLAGTFTACNVAVLGVVPTVLRSGGARSGARALVPPVVALLSGALVISALYGAVGVLLGDRLPQLSTAVIGDGMPVRIVQACVVFTVVGAAFTYLGLAALGRVPDPLARLEQRFPYARLVVFGVLIGAFLIGRPFPLFHKLFQHAAETHNPLYGAGVFVLQSLGNVLVTLAVLAVIAVVARGRLQRWAARDGGRTAGALLVVMGTFTVVYWALRVPAMFGFGWFPVIPW